ncbi:MAG: DUF935 family protein [Xanthomonadaceae bacterium]|nr:DUF935 family protein [Xanthomonadaceae bacterium]MDP2185032.1 DUF935 family protein [Xanthomonadales bacterium]MDZ4114411.1 DUF935 family protein [Xanthomonadaceae bacterium]
MSDEHISRPSPGREIATTGNGRDITRPYTGQLLIPSDSIVTGRSGGDLLIYERVLSEPQVKATFGQRRAAVTSAEWQVEAASERRVDKRAADHLREQLQCIGWDRVTDLMLYGVFYGYAAAEIVYGRKDGLLTWAAIKVRNRRRFRFGERGDLRLITPANPYPGEEAPAPYFWHIATGADNDDEPYGMGLAHWLYWPDKFKRNGIKFWLTFLEKFGMPTAVGEYDANATPTEQSKLLAATEAIQSDSGIIIPKGMTLTLLEAARSGTADYKALHDTMDATIAKVVLGQSASTEGTPGRLGNEELQGDVRADIIKADADLICESFNLGPVRWLTMFNFPDADPPRVFRVLDEPEDANALAERDTKVAALGFKPGLQYIQATYGDHWEAAQDAPGGDAVAAAPAASVSFAAQTAPAPIVGREAQLVDLLARRADPIIAGWIDQIEALVRSAESLEEIRDGLLALLPNLDTEQFGQVMQQALAIAGVAGMGDARDDADA